MKITFVLPTVNMSGGVRVVTIYAQMLAQRGHEVVLVSPARPQHSLKQRFIRFLKGQAEPRRPAKSHLDGSGLDHRVLHTWRPVVDADLPDADVVIATWWETAEWVAALSPAKGAKVYFVQHHEVFDWLPAERCRASYRLPLHKIAVAQWLVNVMRIEYGDESVDLVPNSVDHTQFFAAPRSKQSRPTIGFLYSRAPFKGVDTTLRAIEMLRPQFPDLRLLSFGSERPDGDVPADTHFSFDPAQATLREIYSSCDLWMTASRSEGFNLPAMEAMACWTPVISTRAGWPEEAIQDRVNGICVDVDDVKALAEGASWILSRDENDWGALSRSAYETVRDSSWERSTELFEQSLARAAASRLK